MAEDIPNAESQVQHGMTATPDTLVETNEEQADAADVLGINTSSNRTVALEPSNTSSSEQVTLQKPILKQPIAS